MSTVFCKRDEKGAAVFDTWPQKKRQNAQCLILTNDASAFIGLEVRAFPIAELNRLANPLSPCDNGLRSFSSAKELFELWRDIEAKLLKFPYWTLNALSDIYLDLEDRPLSALFRSLAERAYPDADDTKWEHLVSTENGRPPPPRTPALEDCTPLNEERIAAFFEEGGALSRLMPGYRPRSGQIKMARAVAKAFNTGNHLLAEAGTGVGKSLAYLIPAACWALLNDVAVVVSTNTKNLQTQLIEHDLPIVRNILRESGDSAELLRCALLKGRTNYLCLRKFGVVLERNDFSLEPAKRRQLAAITAWTAFTADGDLDTLQLLHQVFPSFASEFSSSGEECSGRKCRFFKRCFLQKARQIAARAHIVVANHALVFADAGTPGTILPQYAQVVFDEAHNLEEAATSHYSTVVGAHEIVKLLRRISTTKGGTGIVERLAAFAKNGSFPFGDEELECFRERLKDCAAGVDAVYKAMQRFFNEMTALLPDKVLQRRYRRRSVDGVAPEVREYVHNRLFVPCDELQWDEERAHAAKNALCLALAVVAERLRNCAAMFDVPLGYLPLYGDQCAMLEGAATELEVLMGDIEFVFSATDEEFVFWVERRQTARRSKQYETVLNAAPLSVGNALARDLYKTKSSVVFSSATLRYGESFSFVGKRLGLGLADVGRVKTCLSESPFDYLRQCKVFAADFLPMPEAGIGNYDAYIEQLGALLTELFGIGGGRALALFTSFEMMNAVAAQVEKPLRDSSIALLVHGRDGSRDEITARFRSNSASVLFGVQSFWEGVDIPGDALNCVVICRLPFAAVGDPVFEARCEQLKNQGRSDFREYSLPQAVIKFRQGFGRLIRTASDRGAVVIADPRLVKKGYGSEFRKSLPCPVETVSDRLELLEKVRAAIAKA